MPSSAEHGTLGPAFEEATYTSLASVKAALQAYAKENGYAISINSTTPKRVIYVCSKAGNHDNCNQGHAHESKCRKGTSTTKTNCQFRVMAKPVVDTVPIQ
jgi:hypothetical protein